ncbi:hypothetical protein JHK85_005048 [Glycine max]|uniref:Uncharacterized protein n=1 Tax=Glycine soja TaxID=3848 RepID=A0A0B2SCL4_GLYSO|nr:hypothetical protein JHK85_005048 [Glycine max]KHN42805.1 hypothetical protein glysoja_036979 [Glycine soja]
MGLSIEFGGPNRKQVVDVSSFFLILKLKRGFNVLTSFSHSRSHFVVQPPATASILKPSFAPPLLFPGLARPLTLES